MGKDHNSLINESSPYLLQHAYNPVNWIPWSADLFEKAKEQDKLVLLSIGYSSCHWCHVMEHECFEDKEVAELMNQYFINVKVDREERPDVDQVYMTAVQLMTQRGGWPLNCITLPDGRPIYGGTYFPKEQWIHILKSLAHTFSSDRNRVEEYAAKLHEGIINNELVRKVERNNPFEIERLHELVLRWSRSFDRMEGGSSSAPKFPLPNNYKFLLDYAIEYHDEKVLKHVELTLDKMAMGGIYDQVGGGFSRYSVDMLWKVPHFEKMLYDNGQLLSLYATAYKYFKKPMYKRIILQTLSWLDRDMKSDEGSFFSALDADSEGEEGKYYCWSTNELQEILGKDYEWVKIFYNLNQRGYWEENGSYILLRNESDNLFAKSQGWTLDELPAQIAKINEKILSNRRHRIAPGLDDKNLTSWNAILLKGFCDSYTALGEEEFYFHSRKIAHWISEYQMTDSGHLWRTRKNGTSSINAFLEDYAFVIDSFIAFYQITFEKIWLDKALILTEVVKREFQDPESKMCYFTSRDTELIVRKMEINDNVIPSANSVMATNFLFLGQLLDNKEYLEISKQMLANIYDGMEQYGSGYSNWAILLLNHTRNFYQVAIIGDDVKKLNMELQKNYIPNAIFAGGKEIIPMTKGKEAKQKIHICYSGTCLLPTDNVDEALILMKNNPSTN